jgi:hypothetical protein
MQSRNEAEKRGVQREIMTKDDLTILRGVFVHSRNGTADKAGMHRGPLVVG